jgi:probable rRNA maturation factor
MEPVSSPTISMIKKAAESALHAEHKAGPIDVTVMITNDEQIRKLNREFKGEDEITDVLAFNPYTKDESTYGDVWPDFADSDIGSQVNQERLGDIAISLPQVARKEKKNGNTTDNELAMLTIHGVLHLLGYDHRSPEEETVMFGKTKVILSKVFN